MIGLAWVALSALVAIFMYCCSRISNGTRKEMDQAEREARLADPFVDRSDAQRDRESQDTLPQEHLAPR